MAQPRETDTGHQWSRYQHHILAEIDRLGLLVVDMHTKIQQLHVEASLLAQTTARLVLEMEKLGAIKGDVASIKQAAASKTMLWVAVIGGMSGILGMIGTIIAAYLKGGK